MSIFRLPYTLRQLSVPMLAAGGWAGFDSRKSFV